MIRQYGKIVLVASMMLMSTACARSVATQSEDFRLRDSDRFMDDGGS
jgi:hypothetical protein